MLFVPFVCASLGAHSFSVAAPKLEFSSSTPALQMCTGPDAFSHHLTTHYFQGLPTHFAPSSCTSYSASADRCVHLQIIFTWNSTYLLLRTNISRMWRRQLGWKWLVDVSTYCRDAVDKCCTSCSNCYVSVTQRQFMWNTEVDTAGKPCCYVYRSCIYSIVLFSEIHHTLLTCGSSYCSELQHILVGIWDSAALMVQILFEMQPKK